jgi:hypothetical protein
MNRDEHTHQLKQFRQQVYQNFNKRADATMNLVDALSSHGEAHSVVELSLASCFQREHTSVFKAIQAYRPEEQQKTLAQLAASSLPTPQERLFWLLAVDTTPQPRVYAKTLEDRSYVYQPAAVQGTTPVTVGHLYSEVVCLPEKKVQQGHPWVVPLSSQRVSSQDDKELIGAIQISDLLDTPQLPFHDQVCVEVGDASYSKPLYLFVNRAKSNLVSLVRVRGNRTFYHPAAPSAPHQRGHHRWFGAAFSLKKPETWPAPNESVTLPFTSQKGREYQIQIEAWHELLMRGKRKPVPMAMQHYPFTLLRIQLYSATPGKLVHAQPLWILIMGEKRHTLTTSSTSSASANRSSS